MTTPQYQVRQNTPTPPAGYEVVPGTSIKVYQFAFAGEGKAELKVLGDYTKEDIDDLESLLKTTFNGLRRSLSAPKKDASQ